MAASSFLSCTNHFASRYRLVLARKASISSWGTWGPAAGGGGVHTSGGQVATGMGASPGMP